MEVALFDLDNTLIGGDSDYLWGEYLADVGAVEAREHRRENARFFDEYQRGVLDPDEFLAFQLSPLTMHTREVLEAWRADFIAERIEPLILPEALRLLDRHRADGRELAIVTSTNSFITRPIADRLGVRWLLATDPEVGSDGFTGRVQGERCFAEGKVTRVRSWTAEQGFDLRGSWFYTDSHSDLPLLEIVTHPVAVDPDERLRQVAGARNWPVISLR